MKDKMKDTILEKYQVRKSNGEKTAFIEYLKERLGKCGYDRERDITIEEKGKGVFKSRNIVVGNPETADYVLSAHYDTCAVLPFPNLMAPTNPVLFIGYQVLLVIMIVVISALIPFIIGFFCDNALVTVVGFELCMILLLIQLMFGFPNKHTANDNTSGVIALTHFLEALPAELRGKVCVVYFDNEEKGLFGSAFFQKKYKQIMKGKLLVNIDCVGDGREIVLMAKKKAREEALYAQLLSAFEGCEQGFDGSFLSRKMLPMMFPSDQSNFEKGIGVCAVRKCFLGRYTARIHTPLDTKCREENIKYLVEVLVKYTESIG